MSKMPPEMKQEQTWNDEPDEEEQTDCQMDAEARHYGVPYKGQTWVDNQGRYGEVVLNCVNYSTVTFMHEGHCTPLSSEEFMRTFTFVTSPYIL